MSSPAVTVTALRRVPLSAARAFEAEMRRFFAYAVAQPGCIGLQLLDRDVGTEVEYTVIAGFSSLVDRQRFVGDRDYTRWMNTLDAHASRPAEIEEHQGLRILLTLGTPGPPRWKVAFTTWLGVNVVTTPLVPLMPRLETWIPFPWSNLLLNIVVVALLAWVIMPALTRILSRWLEQRAEA